MFITVMAAYVVQVQYYHSCLRGARTTESWLPVLAGTVQFCLGCLLRGRDRIFMDAIYGNWYNSLMAAYTDTAQLLYCHGCLYGYWNSTVMAVIWVLIQQYHGFLCGTGSVLPWLPIWVLVQRYSSTVMAASAGQV